MSINPLSLRHPVFAKPAFASVFLLGFLAHGTVLGMMFFIVRFWDAVLVQGLPWRSRWGDLLAILFFVLAGQGLRFFYARSAAHFASTTVSRLRSLFWKGLLSAPALASRTEGETSQEGPSRLLKVCDALEPWFGQFLPQAFLAVASPLLVFGLALFFDPLTALVLGVTGPLLPVFLALIGIRARERSEKQWKSLARLRFLFLESLQGLKTLKILGRSSSRRQELASADAEFRERTLAVLRTAFLSALALEWTATLGTALVAVEVALRLLSGRLDFFPGLLVLLWTPEFYRPIRQLGLGFHASLDAKTAIKDNPHFFNSLCVSENDKKFAAPEPSNYMLRLQVGERFFNVGPGIPAMVTGPSGTGKTRFILSYLGFIESNNPKSFLTPVLNHEYIAWLPQNPVLYSGALVDCLCPQGRVPDVRVWEALRRVGLDELVNNLPGKLETSVEENGRNFSGGERRRLALARLLLLDRPVWFLDEPLAGLDAQAAGLVLALLEFESRKRTLLMVSHHRRSLEGAERIFFLLDGEVNAVGSHDELWASHPIYRATVQGEDDERAR